MPNSGASNEGKGAVAAHIAPDYHAHVRVGAANAGHTIYVNGGSDQIPVAEKKVLQQIPCAAYANPHAVCMIGPGALISTHILVDEIQRNEEWRQARGYDPLMLYIDRRAHTITLDQIRRESETDLAEKIGSTSTIAKEGIGQAQADRVMREGEEISPENLPFWSRYDGLRPGVDVPTLIREAGRSGHVLLEGTQGTGLSLTTGYYPYCTSRNTTATGLLADCGLAPADLDKSILVARTFPIRVAGPSGPFAPGSEEITFQEIGVPPETTTVTKKTRRVATFSMRQIREAYELNRARRTEIALMFCDYVAPSLEGKSGDGMTFPDSYTAPDQTALIEMINEINAHCEHAAGQTVRYLGTGPDTIVDLETPPPAV